jgi:transposase InsO family protein
MIMGFIDTMRAEGHAVESICRVLREQGLAVAARTYRDWCHPKMVAARTVTDARVIDAILEACWRVDEDGVRRLTPEGLYGRRKLTAYLRRHGLPTVAESTVARCMRVLGHRGVVRAKSHRTTIPAADGHRAVDLVNRDFTAPAPNRVWVADFTYVRTWAGFVYVAFVLDVFAQRILAWHASTSKTVPLVTTPLRMAVWARERDGHPITADELISHSDAGSQYTAIRFTERLTLERIRPSIGTVGDAYDNALMETVIGLYKTECIRTTVFHPGAYKTITDVEYATAGWVDWYNNRRLHSTLGMHTPVEHETAHYAARTPAGSHT